MRTVGTLAILVFVVLLLGGVSTRLQPPSWAAEPQVDDVPLFLAVGQSSADNWQTECVDCSRYFERMTDRSLRLDDEGHAHIAYGGHHLYYARHDGTLWHYETVDESPTVGEYASLALDAANRPHISYYDTANRDLKYAWHDGAAWQFETVDSAGAVGEYSSLALDGAGRPHISYYDGSNQDLKYAWHDGAAWHTQTVDSEGQVGEYTSLALDGAGRPHISYYYSYYDDWYQTWWGMPKYARHDGVGWHTEALETHGIGGWYTSLVLDGTGRPHITFHHYAYNECHFNHCEIVATGDLLYAWHDGTQWYQRTVNEWPNDVEVGLYTSLALDGAGRPHVSYYDKTHGALEHAWHDGTAWQTETVDDTGDTGLYTSLALDETGQPHVSYYSHGNGELRYARHDETAWQIQAVDRAARGGWDSSLALDSAGQPHVSYYAGYPNHDLRYGWHNGTAWQIEAVDTTGEVGDFTSLALDGLGRPHISYFSCGYPPPCTTGELKYAWHDGTQWHYEAVDGLSDDEAGMYTSLALSEEGRPHISYYYRYYDDQYHAWGMLRYAWHDGTAWQIETVDRAGDVGRYTSLALDAADRPHISYYDDTNKDLKHAWHDGAAWHSETVDSAGGVGQYSSLALDGEGQPHISYYDNTNGDLKYAWHDAAGWHIQTMASAGDVGQYSSLALDASNRPHISYYDLSNGALKYTRDDGMAWQVDQRGGQYSALALDAEGRPHISYHHVHENGLKYARLMPSLSLDKQAEPRDGLRNNETLTYTLTLSGHDLNVRLWDPLPATVRYVTGSLTPPAIYDPTTRAVTWQGTLPTDAAQVIRFQVTPDTTGSEAMALSQPIVNTAWLTDTDSGKRVSATVIVNGWRAHMPLMMRYSWQGASASHGD